MYDPKSPSLMLLLLLLLAFATNTFGYKTIIDVLSEDARFERLIGCLQRTRLVPEFNRLEAGTFFAPDNAAFEMFEGKITKELLLYHLLPAPMAGQDFYQGQVLESKLVQPDLLGEEHPGQRIKMTKEGRLGKGRGKVYVNGVEITESDIAVNNQTYIHAIGEILQPPRSIVDTLLDNEPLYNLLDKVNITQILKERRPFTVFVSREEALGSFKSTEKAYLTSDYGLDDLGLLLKYTVIEQPIYAADFLGGNSTYKTLSGESVDISVSRDGTISVNGKSIIQSDILAANGVIHRLEESIVPATLSFNPRKYLYGLNNTKFVSLMDRYNLAHYLDNKEAVKYTFLVPKNEDTRDESISEELKQAWLSYHILSEPRLPNQLSDHQLVNTEFHSTQLNGVSQKLPVYVDTGTNTLSRSIRFLHSRVLEDPEYVHGNVIYQLSESLELPGDVISTLAVDLDLSTFIASLYVSETANEIKETKGITLFAPSNTAFESLGLVAQYLMHPAAKSRLRNVLQYHVVKGMLYREDMAQGFRELPTLVGNQTKLRIGPSPDKKDIFVGPPSPNTRSGTVKQTDLLIGNGVVHKLDMVQFPMDFQINSFDLLVGIEASTMLEVLKKANMLNLLNETDAVVLVPSNRAFGRIDLDALLKNQYEVERLAKLHFVPMQWQDRWNGGGGHSLLTTYADYTEYPTLLSDRDAVIFEESETRLAIHVKGQPKAGVAVVRGMGRTFGRASGGVLLIDEVLIPVRRGIFGLPWGWSIAVITLICIASTSFLGIAAYFGYKLYKRRRLGYQPIAE
ncbi:FAS1 domain-containing protein [Dichotomocladium elegans]|nr:FAS1 domain-containing protein [Dichotomocladium elegans]